MGCGAAFLTCVLALRGVARVIGIDSDPGFLRAAAALARAAGVQLDLYELSAEQLSELAGEGIHGAVSSSFIEHIYDLQAHFATVHRTLQPGGRYVAATSLNGLHPPTVRQYRPVHRRVESISSANDEECFASVRRQMIRELWPEVGDADLERLVRCTRCLAGDDLRRVVEQVRHGGRCRPATTWYSSETYDPQNGYRPDRLLNPFMARRMMRAAGFAARLERPRPGLGASGGVRLAGKRFVARTCPEHVLYLLSWGFTLRGDL